MKFLIITHVEHLKIENRYFAYAPYVNEMNIWLKYADEVLLVAPCIINKKNVLDATYNHDVIRFYNTNTINIKSFSAAFKTLIALPRICFQIYCAMHKATHIHLRCPGNMGLIGCVIQILFPKKQKTAKYAGNWDNKSKQPWSYRLQKWILSNTFLTKNMQVLVYGVWNNQTKNIKPFFTATYSKQEIQNTVDLVHKIESEIIIKFLFVGTLSIGKQPLYTIQLIEKLSKKIPNIQLELYGEGVLRNEIEEYIKQNNLKQIVFLRGNQSKEIVKEAYQNSHFLMLPSKSEGWPKAIAEAMFWGCVPLATAVSCVPFMLDNGNRGLLLTKNSEQDTKAIETLICDTSAYQKMATNSKNWSRQYTIEKFENEIKKLLFYK